MTTNAPLALTNPTDLTELDQLILDEAANDAAAYDPIPTKITIAPGGINQFVTSDGETMKSIAAIVAISQKARAYWPDAGTGQPPFCASQDGATGVVNMAHSVEQFQAAASALPMPHPAVILLTEQRDLPHSFPCATCPLAQWGSQQRGGKQSRGQACKSLRRLVILVDGWAQPALLTLPPTSLKAFDAYASSLAQRKSAYFAAWTKIALEAQKSANGEPYSVAAFSVAAKLTDPAQIRAVIALRNQYAELVRGMAIDANDYDTGAPTIHGATPDDDPLPPF